jgi:hypothetical protein
VERRGVVPGRRAFAAVSLLPAERRKLQTALNLIYASG